MATNDEARKRRALMRAQKRAMTDERLIDEWRRLRLARRGDRIMERDIVASEIRRRELERKAGAIPVTEIPKLADQIKRKVAEGDIKDVEDIAASIHRWAQATRLLHGYIENDKAYEEMLP